VQRTDHKYVAVSFPDNHGEFAQHQEAFHRSERVHLSLDIPFWRCVFLRRHLHCHHCIRRVAQCKAKMNPLSMMIMMMMMLAMMLTETLLQLPSTILYTQLHNMFIIIIYYLNIKFNIVNECNTIHSHSVTILLLHDEHRELQKKNNTINILKVCFCLSLWSRRINISLWCFMLPYEVCNSNEDIFDYVFRMRVFSFLD